MAIVDAFVIAILVFGGLFFTKMILASRAKRKVDAEKAEVARKNKVAVANASAYDALKSSDRAQIKTAIILHGDDMDADLAQRLRDRLADSDVS